MQNITSIIDKRYYRLNDDGSYQVWNRYKDGSILEFNFSAERFFQLKRELESLGDTYLPESEM